MKRTYKIVLLLAALAVLAGGGAYWYTFLQPHKNMQKARPDFKLNAENLFTDYSSDENAANSKYLGKVLELTGKVVEVKNEDKQTVVVLEDILFGVSTYLDSSFCAANSELLKEINQGQTVTIRGQCDGMLSDVVVSRAVIVK